MTNDLQYEFMGFKPDEKINSFVSRVAETLHYSAPSDSAMKLVIKKSKNRIRASCRIASLAGTFVADSISDNPIRAVQQIEQKIRKELDDWKMRRFERVASENKAVQDLM
jgi:ribosome-associated translation inhibitor RaiA